MTDAQRLQAQLEAVRDLLDRGRVRPALDSWEDFARRYAEDLDLSLKLARQKERLEARKNKRLRLPVATAQQPASAT